MERTALVCDDAQFMRFTMSKILKAAGYTIVAEATTGAEAVAKYRETQPTVVTMDIVMPDMDGLQALRMILNEYPDARVLMCSAAANSATVDEALQEGAREFIVKPFQPSRVMEAIRRATGLELRAV